MSKLYQAGADLGFSRGGGGGGVGFSKKNRKFCDDLFFLGRPN